MPLQPSAIVSMQFFGIDAASSTTNQRIANHDTEFFNSDGSIVGTAKTTQRITNFSSEYYNTQGQLIGTSISEWGGPIVATTYYVNNQKVGTSKTTWGLTNHDTSYYDVDGNLINRSTTIKNIAQSTTQYNLPVTPKNEAATVSTNQSTTFSAQNNNRREKGSKPENNKGKCCSIM